MYLKKYILLYNDLVNQSMPDSGYGISSYPALAVYAQYKCSAQVCDLWLIKDLLHTNKAIIITWGCRGC